MPYRVNTIRRHLQCPWESLHLHLGYLQRAGNGKKCDPGDYLGEGQQRSLGREELA